MMVDDSSEIRRALEGPEQGARALLSAILERYRPRLERTVRLRMDRRLQRRVDAADVIQEAYLHAASHWDDYRRHPEMPPFVWLRLLALQKLAALHRHHLGTQARDAKREVSLYRGALPEASTEALAAQLLGRLTSPSVAARRAERKVLFQEALNRLPSIDREVLLLRHFEELTNKETAQVLGISPTAACNRYVRALKRLKHLLTDLTGGAEELRT